MARKKSVVTDVLESSCKPLLELSFDSPLFAVAAHPVKPVIALGLANGYVHVFEYDPAKLALYAHNISEENKTKEKKEQTKKAWLVERVQKDANYNNALALLWRTKRHRGSVRSIAFNANGDELYTVGSDSVVKKANSLTGKVIAKASIKECAPTKIVKSESHPFLVLGDETGDVRILNSDTLEITNTVEGAHEDAVNDIIPMKHKSAYQFVTVGSTTLSVIDTRKPKPRLTSENQEDEVLSCCYVDPEKGDTIVCGMGEGIVTMWRQSKNELTDQISRVKVNKDESIDCVISTLKEDDCIWCGCSNGDVFKVDVKHGRLVESRVHSYSDEVGLLDLDCEYRLISAGMDKLKLWGDDDDDDEADDDEDSIEFTDSSEDEEGDAEEEADEEEFQGFSDSEQAQDAEQAEPQPKKKKQKLTTKQIRNMQKHEHGIRKFDDL